VTVWLGKLKKKSKCYQNDVSVSHVLKYNGVKKIIWWKGPINGNVQNIKD
jgi:hypothetical protein